MSESVHRVRQAVFALTCRDDETALEAQRRLETALSGSLSSLLEERFDTIAQNGAIYRVKRLEIDLGVLDLERMDDEEIRRLVRDKLETISSIGRPESDNEVPLSYSVAESLLGFLKTGNLPWDAPVRHLDEMESVVESMSVEEQGRFRTTLVDVLAHPSARLRLAYQFSPSFIRRMLHLLLPEGAEILAKWLAEAGEDPSLPEWRLVLLSVAASSLDRPVQELETRLRAAVDDQWSNAGRESLAPSVRRDAEHEVDEPGAAGYVNGRSEPDEPIDVRYTESAGLVLLHPFLTRYFEALGLVDRGRSFTDAESQVRAVHLLGYLATGNEHPEEHRLQLEKILCGFPLEAPLVGIRDLTEEEKAESDRLLNAVIGHWDRLGNTTVDGFREAFLQRTGRLVIENDAWELTVERKAIDVLLSSLPWGLYRLSLSWMSRRMIVNWA